jgi:hypothetical protein
MSATTTQLLSSGEFCKLCYDTIPLHSASANVSFYTNNSKMPNFGFVTLLSQMSDMLRAAERSVELCVGLKLQVTPENKEKFYEVTHPFLVNDQLDTQFLFCMFISILYMFRATSCSSLGGSIVSILHLVCVTPKTSEWSKITKGES